jgi:hypothetical protein
VRLLRERLSRAVEVGTVDRFQGREAAVVFQAMASSSGEDVPTCDGVRVALVTVRGNTSLIGAAFAGLEPAPCQCKTKPRRRSDGR